MEIPLHHHNRDGGLRPDCKRCQLEAAAPDLLEACEKLLVVAPTLWGADREDWPRIMDRIEAVIDKATS